MHEPYVLSLVKRHVFQEYRYKLFTELQQRLSESGSFAPRVSDRGMPRRVRTSHMEFCVLRTAEESPGPMCEELQLLEVIGVARAWRILHELFYLYYIQRRQALIPPDNRERMMFCQWLLTKYVVNTVCN
jgi:hypothetical protein